MGGDTYEIEVTATYSNGTTIKDTFDLKVVTASLDTEIFDALNMLEEKGADLIQMDDSGVAINEIMMMAKADEVNLNYPAIPADNELLEALSLLDANSIV